MSVKPTDMLSAKPAPVLWPRDWQPEQVSELASACFALLFNTRRWIHRRLETITFIDANSIGRRISVDFTIPVLGEGILSDPDTERDLYVPLSLLRKRELCAFDLRDEHDRALAMPTRAQNAAVALAMLSGAAQALIGSQTLHGDVLDDLACIASDDRAQAEAAFKALISPDADCASAEQRRTLMAEPRLRSLAEDLVHSFIFLVPLHAKPGDRRVIKFAYEEAPGERVEDGAARRTALARTFGLKPVPYLLPASSMGDSASYHIEVAVPDEVEVASTRVIDLKRQQVLSETVEPADAGRVHIYHADAQRTVWGLVEVALRPARGGLQMAALLTVLITALLLSFGAHNLNGLVSRTDDASALLLAIPALFASYLLRPAEHRLVTHLFAGMRALVLLSGLCSLSASATLVAGMHRRALALTWMVLTDVCWIAAGVLAASLLAHARPARRIERRMTSTGGSPQGLPPSGCPQALAACKLSLDGLPVESAEGWRSGFEGMDSEAGIERTLALAASIRAHGAAPRRH